MFWCKWTLTRIAASSISLFALACFFVCYPTKLKDFFIRTKGYNIIICSPQGSHRYSLTYFPWCEAGKVFQFNEKEYFRWLRFGFFRWRMFNDVTKILVCPTFDFNRFERESQIFADNHRHIVKVQLQFKPLLRRARVFNGKHHKLCHRRNSIELINLSIKCNLWHPRNDNKIHMSGASAASILHPPFAYFTS